MNNKNQFNQNIKIIIKNPISKEKSIQKTKELCVFLSKTWHMPLDKNT